jgi:tetratricopeptide (TPR) repeat protein
MQRFLAVVAAIVVVLTMVIAWSSLRMNYSEIAWQLQKQEFVEGNLSRMYLLARFVDQRNLYQDVVDRSAVDRNEYEIGLLMDKSNPKDWSRLKATDFLDKVSLRIVNTLRYSIDKHPIAEPKEIQSLELLEYAFVMEQNKEYQKALNLYDEAFPIISDPSLMGMLLIHQGFSQAMLGNIAQAKKLYLHVIQLNSHNEQSVTAGILLQHLEQIVEERSVVQKSSLPPVEKARKMSQLMQCGDVLKTLKTSTQEKPSDQADILMIRGLCEEETGNKQQALNNYLGAIAVGGKNNVSKDANRRLFLMGSQIQNGARLESIAKEINKNLGDTLLESMHVSPVDTTKIKLPIRDTVIPSSPVVSEKFMAELKTKVEAIVEAQKIETIKAQPLLPKLVINPEPPLVKDVKVAPKTPLQHSFIKVVLKNGKTFSGEILSTPDEDVMRIKTLIGVIGVRKADIYNMTVE